MFYRWWNGSQGVRIRCEKLSQIPRELHVLSSLLFVMSIWTFGPSEWIYSNIERVWRHEKWTTQHFEIWKPMKAFGWYNARALRLAIDFATAKAINVIFVVAFEGQLAQNIGFGWPQIWLGHIGVPLMMCLLLESIKSWSNGTLPLGETYQRTVHISPTWSMPVRKLHCAKAQWNSFIGGHSQLWFPCH